MLFRFSLLAGALACSIPTLAFAQADTGLPGDRRVGPGEPDTVVVPVAPAPAPDPTPDTPPDSATLPPPIVIDETDERRNDTEPTELLYIAPISGFEYVGTAIVDGASTGGASIPTPGTGAGISDTSGFGVGAGGHIGFMLGNFRVGVMYDHAELFSVSRLHYDRAFLELGLGGRRGILGISATAAAGYTFMGSSRIDTRHGVGARLALAFDFYIGRHFSIGPEIAGYGAAYFIDNNTRMAAWGVTIGPRFGIHI